MIQLNPFINLYFTVPIGRIKQVQSMVVIVLFVSGICTSQNSMFVPVALVALLHIAAADGSNFIHFTYQGMHIAV